MITSDKSKENRRSKPWDFWLLRFIASDDKEGRAFDDLMWSVGGSPPYGDVPYKEAVAVYNLLQQFLEPSITPENAYENVRKLIKRNQERIDALELFKCYDRITSSSKNISECDVNKGISLSEKLKHKPVLSYFLTLKAELLYLIGEIPEARMLTLKALSVYLSLVHEDPVYLTRASKIAKNAIIFTALNADFSVARRLLDQMRYVLNQQSLVQLQNMLGKEHVFKKELSLIKKEASNYRNSGNYLKALELFTEAERLAYDEENETILCGLLGDKAIQYQNLGNTRKAIQTYQKAIKLSHKHQDFQNLSRWNQNLGLIYLEKGNNNAAGQCLKEGIESAIKSEIPFFISTAAVNYAKLLAEQKRYQEAIELSEQAIKKCPDHPKLLDILRQNKISIYERWGSTLTDEGQISEAFRAYENALNLLSLDSIDEKKRAMLLHIEIAKLFEQHQYDLENSLLALDRAIRLAKELDGNELTNEMIERRKELKRLRFSYSNIDLGPGDVDEINRNISKAVSEGNREEEARSRIHLCNVLLLNNDDKFNEAFEEAVGLFRARLKDRRRELILLLNSTIHFLEVEQKSRALTLAKRALYLAESGNIVSRIIANLNIGRVLTEGFNEPRRAMDYNLEAIRLLKNYIQQNQNDATKFLSNAKMALGIAGKTALGLEMYDEAIDIITLIDPKGADKILNMREKRIQKQTRPDIGELKDMKNPDLDPILEAWRAAKSLKSSVRDAQIDVRLERMKKAVTILGWEESKNRLERASISSEMHETSHGGPAGIIKLAQMVAINKVNHDTAVEITQGLEISNDDLECLGIYAFQDTTLSNSGATPALLYICAEVTTDPLLAGRFFRVLGMLSRTQSPEAAIEFYLKGDKRLMEGSYDAMRAYLRNEAAVLMLDLNRSEDAIEMAYTAKKLAENMGKTKLALNAYANMGVAFIQLERIEEAVTIFEEIEKLQESIDDKEGLKLTRFNLSACYTKLGRDIQLDIDSHDPDSLFNRASQLYLQENYTKSIELFNRGFNLIKTNEQRYRHEGIVRSNYAETLYIAGHKEEAIEEMKHAVKIFEKKNDEIGLHKSYSWLVEATIKNAVISEYYAEQALQLGKKLGNSETLAIDLALMGNAKIAAGKYDEAVKHLKEANRLSDNNLIKFNLGEALVNAGRAKEAIPLFNDLLTLAEAADNKRDQITSLIGLAKASQSLSQLSKAINLFRKALIKAERLGLDDVLVHIYNYLGLALLSLAKLEEAAKIFEKGIDHARQLGFDREEISLLSNLGSTLKEMGDLDGAEKTILHVLDISRKKGIRNSESIALTTLGDIYSHKNRFEQALSNYLEAVDLAHEMNDSSSEAAILNRVGTMYSGLGKPERAVEYHNRASKIHEKLEKWNHMIIDLLNLGNTYIILDEVENARARALNKAKEISRFYNVKENKWNLDFLDGRVASAEGNWYQARESFRSAILGLESVRHSLKTPMQQRQWASQKTNVYNIASEMAILASDGGSAIEFIECNKTRFLQAINERRIRRPQGVDEELWLWYERAANKRSELQGRRRSRLFSEDVNIDEQQEKAEDEFNKARARVEASKEDIIKDLPVFEYPSWKQLVKSIPTNYVTVSIAIYSKGLGIVCVGKDASGEAWAKAKMYETFNESDLDSLIYGNTDALRSVIVERTFDAIQPKELGWVVGSILPASSQLWNKTISRICRIIGKCVWPKILDMIPVEVKNLILVPSAGFNLLPLHAARLEDGSCIDEHYYISYIPSLGLLEKIQAHHHLPEQINIGQIANPTEDLTFSRLEAYEVSKTFNPSSVKLYANDKATLNRTLCLLRNSDIFHFCGHAFYDSIEPFRSGLFCAPQKGDSGILSLGTILDRLGTIRSKFVILSACEAGQIDPSDKLDDFLGLPGGFLISGANVVLATFWSVHDLATCLLLEKFFELLNLSNMSVTEALTCSQQWLRDKVTVEFVTEKIAEWLKESKDPKEILILDMHHGIWAEKDDRMALPFHDEVFWAAFYITGLLHPIARAV